MSDVPTDPVAALRALLTLHEGEARTTEDIFTASSQFMPSGRIYGGQVLAQAVLASERTLPDDGRIVHSLHGYFVRPGDVRHGVTYSVDRIHDGRSFSTRRTQAFQGGVPIFSMIASFQVPGPGLEHQAPMPAGIPEPESLPAAPAPLAMIDEELAARVFAQSPVELREIPLAERATDGADALRHAVWMRVRRRLPDDPVLHRAILAYLSDLTIQAPVIAVHGVSWGSPGLKMASLDHALWWHRPARTDEWLLYAQESPSARGGRGLATGHIYTRDGVLVATVAQEVMVRVPEADEVTPDGDASPAARPGTAPTPPGPRG